MSVCICLYKTVQPPSAKQSIKQSNIHYQTPSINQTSSKNKHPLPNTIKQSNIHYQTPSLNQTPSKINHPLRCPQLSQPAVPNTSSVTNKPSQNVSASAYPLLIAYWFHLNSHHLLFKISESIPQFWHQYCSHKAMHSARPVHHIVKTFCQTIFVSLLWSWRQLSVRIPSLIVSESHKS
jgi:hypothetical protein